MSELLFGLGKSGSLGQRENQRLLLPPAFTGRAHAGFCRDLRDRRFGQGFHQRVTRSFDVEEGTPQVQCVVFVSRRQDDVNRIRDCLFAETIWRS